MNPTDALGFAAAEDLSRIFGNCSSEYSSGATLHWSDQVEIHLSSTGESACALSSSLRRAAADTGAGARPTLECK